MPNISDNQFLFGIEELMIFKVARDVYVCS